MAHVLLPCDLPSWPQVQRHLSQLRLASDIDSLMEGMRRIHDICSISLDPDDRHEPNDQLFNPLRRFLEEACSEDERARFVRYTLPCLVNHAMHLRVVRPSEGFHYLLQQEERSVMLDRQFILSLLANAFFSTFPRRTIKTHPTLQDFNFVQLFQHLETDSQQLKLKSILRHLEGAGYNDSCNGNVRYTRQVVSPASIPSLPHWLCSDKPLCPLVLRNTGGIEEAEPHVYKACFCSPLVGGDVLREGFSQESRLFSLMPELLVCICFAEALLFNEAIVVQGVRQNLLAGETDVCLLDASNFSVQPGKQYEDQALVRELTKCYAAFLQPRPAARLSPVGRSASPTPPPAVERRRSSIGSTQSFKTSLPDWAREDDKKSKNSSIYNHTEYHLKPPHLLLKQQSSNCSDIFEDAFENLSFDKLTETKKSVDLTILPTKMKEIKFVSNISKTTDSLDSIASSLLKMGRNQSKENKTNEVLRHSSGTPNAQIEKSRLETPELKHASIYRMAEENALEISRYQKEMENILNDLAKFSVDFNPKVLIPNESISQRAKQRKLSLQSSKQSDLIPTRENRKLTEKSFSRDSESSDHRLKLLKPMKNDQYLRKYSDPLDLFKLPQRNPFGTDIVPVRKYSDPFSICSRPERFSSEEKSTPKKVLTQESTESGYKRSLSRASSRRQKSEVVDPSIQIVETFISELLNHERKKRTLEKRKSRSWGQISQGTFSEDDEYFTADENMSDTELGISAEHRRRMLRVETPGSEESTGFHLGTDDELSKHERYEDFRRRIRCRTRSRRSRRSSSSYLGSSSDMEDISEEDMIDRPGVMRAASSEPNLAGVPLAVPPPPTTAPLVPGRRLMMTTYSGQLKAYSYDGVKPNLPVPFKAKFRRRRFQEDEDSTGGSSLEDLSVDSEVPVYNPYCRVESQDSSILPDDLDVDTDYPSALMPTVEGLKPVAGGRWGCGTRHSGDPQLKVAIQWLAASLALLPSLVVYTAQDPALAQLRQVSRKAEKQGWTVGDLACETLRYCRSRRSSHRTPSQLFSLLLGGTFLSHDSLE